MGGKRGLTEAGRVGRDRERKGGSAESGVASACQPAASRFVRLTANFMVDGFSALAREKAP